MQLLDWARQRRVQVIDGACLVFGLEANGKSVGTSGDAGTFSMGIGKPLMGPAGGVLVTCNDTVGERIWGRIAGLDEAPGGEACRRLRAFVARYGLPRIRLAVDTAGGFVAARLARGSLGRREARSGDRDAVVASTTCRDRRSACPRADRAVAGSTTVSSGQRRGAAGDPEPRQHGDRSGDSPSTVGRCRRDGVDVHSASPALRRLVVPEGTAAVHGAGLARGVRTLPTTPGSEAD